MHLRPGDRHPMRFPAPEQTLPADQLGRIHFVGIGGVGMAPLARTMLGRGLPVSGSDIKDTVAVQALRALGATIAIGQAPENLEGVDTVVVSWSAVGSAVAAALG